MLKFVAYSGYMLPQRLISLVTACAALLLVHGEAVHAQVRCEESKLNWVSLAREKINSQLDEELEARNRCLKSVCPKPEAMPKPVLSGREYAELDKQVDQILNANKEAIFKSALKWDRTWSKARGSLADYKRLRGTDAVAANLALLESLDSLKFRFDIDDVDYETLLQYEFPRLSKAEITQIREASSARSQAYFEVSGSDSLKHIFREPTPVLRQRKLLELAEKKRRELNSLRTQNPLLYSARPAFDEFQVDPALQEQLRRGRSISSFDEEEMFKELISVNVTHELLAHAEKYPALARVPDLDKFVSQAEFAVQVSEKSHAPALEATVERCSERLKDTLRQLPSERERGEARVITDGARLAALKKWTSYFSIQTASVVRDRLKNTEVELPPSPQTFISQLKAIAEKDQAKGEAALARSEERLLQKRGLASAAYAVDTYHPDGWAATMDFCSWNAGMIEDSFNHQSQLRGLANTMRLSSSHVRHPERGFSVSVHEFSHAADPKTLAQLGFKISGHSLAKRNRLSACLKSQHGRNLETESRKASSGFRRTNQYADFEDFADLHLSSNTHFCASTDPNSLEGDDYGPEWHSPNTFRILHGEFARKGRLTPACQNYVDKYRKWNFKDCLEAAE